ncbi:MAG: T9SS type A sorting domain-containing protein [Flavobacteriales bacterium]
MKKHLQQLFLPFLLLTGITVSAQPGLEWSRDVFCDFNDFTPNFVTKPITDAQGNVYVAGALNKDASFLNRSPVLMKFSPQGDLLWQYVHPRLGYTPNDGHQGNSTFTDIAFDSEGNILAAGAAPYDTTVFGLKPILVKINPQGQMLWQKIMYTDVPNLFNYGNPLCTDNEGNVYFAAIRPVSGSSATNHQARLWKFNAQGEQQWEHVFIYGVMYRTFIYNMEYLPGSNTVILSGDIRITADYWIPFISKHNTATGEQTLEKRFSTNPTSYLEAMYVNENEEVYVSLYSDDGIARIRKFDAALEEVFVLSYKPDGSYDNNFGRIIPLSDGNLLASGYSYATNQAVSGRAVYMKFTPSGTPLDTVVMAADAEEYFYDVAELNGELFFTGATTNSADEYALKLWRTNLQGSLLGSFVYDKTDITYSEGFWLHVDGNAVYATGKSYKDNQSGVCLLKTLPQLLVTSLSEAMESISFDVYPNPALDYFVIRSETIGVEYQITDALGRSMASGMLNDTQQVIPTANWEKGLYLVRVHSPKGALTRKVWKY